MKNWLFVFVGTIVALSSASYVTTLVYYSWPINDLSIRSASLFGDSFGFLNAFFTGGAFLLVLWTIHIQQKELALQREELSKMVSQQDRQLHTELVRIAMEDPELCTVWGNRFGSYKKDRQYMYINLILSHWIYLFKQGLIGKRHLKHQLSEYMSTSDLFRLYWSDVRLKREEFAQFDEKSAVFHRIAEEAYRSALASSSEQDTMEQPST